MYGTAKTHWIPFLPQLLPNPSLPLVPPHANAATLRHPANVIAIPPIHLTPPSHNSSPPSLPHLYPLYPPLLLIAKSRWVLGPPRSHTTSIYPTRASTTPMCNNVIAPSSIHPSPSSPNSSLPSLPHLRPLYSPLPLIAKSRWVQDLPWTHTTSPTLTKRQNQCATSW